MVCAGSLLRAREKKSQNDEMNLFIYTDKKVTDKKRSQSVEPGNKAINYLFELANAMI